MLDREFQYYKNHQAELVEKYNGKFVAIIGEAVVGAYSTELEAYTEMKKTKEPGTFLIQQVSPGDTGYTQTFHSRVAFR